MDNFKRMTAFARVVEAGSFAGAAKRLGMARSAVSRHIAQLEKDFGVRLLNRTTRRLGLTEAGRIYYRSCATILAEAEAAERRIRRLRDEPAGTLTLAGPTGLGPRLAALAQDFIQRHPMLNIELRLDDRVVDMVAEGIDVSIRIGWLADSRLIARRLCDSPRVLCASPDYIERHGRPRTPSQLAEHECIIFTLLPTPHQWTFTRNGRTETVHVNGRMRTDSAIAMRSLVLEGGGIAPLSRFLVADELAAGRVEPLLPGYDCGNAGVYAVYQDRHYKQTKVSLFIDFVEARMKRLP